MIALNYESTDVVFRRKVRAAAVVLPEPDPRPAGLPRSERLDVLDLVPAALHHVQLVHRVDRSVMLVTILRDVIKRDDRGTRLTERSDESLIERLDVITTQGVEVH